MIVAISGSTGFIGSALAGRLEELGWTVRKIDRAAFQKPENEFLENYIEGCDIVINLAGAPLTKKWTEAYKKEILGSRVQATRRIARAICAAQKKPSLLVSGSAIGIYSSGGTHTETSTAYADSFLASVCKAWESEASQADGCTRVVTLRTGLVLGSEGGALAKMYRPFRIGLGGRTGSGTQAVSFIHIFDMVNAILFIMENNSLRGAVNAVSPFPTTNEDFTQKLARVLKQPRAFATPVWLLKMMYGEGASVLLEGQRVLPGKLQQAGFSFRYPTLQNVLVRIYG